MMQLPNSTTRLYLGLAQLAALLFASNLPLTPIPAIAAGVSIDTRDLESTAQLYVAEMIRLKTREADTDFVSREAEYLRKDVEISTPFRRAIVSLSSPSSSTNGRLLSALGETTKQAAATTDTQLDKLRKGVGLSRQRCIDRRTLVYQHSHRYLAGTRLRHVAIICLYLLLALSCALIVAICYRHRLRRKHHTGVFTAFFLLILPTLAAVAVLYMLPALVIHQSFSSGGEPVANLESHRQEIDRLIDSVNEADRQFSQVDRAFQNAQRDWKDSIDQSSDSVRSLVTDWFDARQRLRLAFVEAAILESLLKRLQRDQAMLVAIETQETQDDAIFLARVIVAIIASVLLGTTVLFRHFTRVRGDRKRCPKCYHKYTPDATETIFPAEQKSSQKNTDVVCQQKWDGRNTCGFSIRQDHLSASKLFFTIAGIPESGKTYWLGVIYDRLNRHNYTEQLNFIPIDTAGNTKLRRIVGRLRNGERQMAATPEVLPDPVVFSLTDRDPFGRSHVLLNIFDYSGEVFRSHEFQQSPLRRRMLNSDGAFLFLDSTKSADVHLQELRNLAADAERNNMTAPGAICLTKIDELVKQESHPDIHRCLESFCQLERDLELCRNKMAQLHQRSQITSDLLRHLWPHTDIESILHDIFRRDYLFFPITSTGFTSDHEPINPHYVLEPLMWLLHRNGHHTFVESYIE